MISGYTGGTREHPIYDTVCLGTTGHAEAVEITFDPEVITYQTLLEAFFLLHDPTTLNRQGADIGTQYRSAIFFHSDEQRAIAENIMRMESEKRGQSIATELTASSKFWPAEKQHQVYYDANREAPYCRLVIDPKITKLTKAFADKLKSE